MLVSLLLFFRFSPPVTGHPPPERLCYQVGGRDTHRMEASGCQSGSGCPYSVGTVALFRKGATLRAQSIWRAVTLSFSPLPSEGARRMFHHWPPPNWRLSRPQVLSFAPGTRATQFSELAGKFGHFTCICESLGRVVSGPGAAASLGDGSFECTSASFDRSRASAESAISEPSGHTKLSESLLTSSLA